MKLGTLFACCVAVLPTPRPVLAHSKVLNKKCSEEVNGYMTHFQYDTLMVIGQQCAIQSAGLDLIGREDELEFSVWPNTFQQEYFRGK